MLEKGAKVSARDRDGRSALHYAASEGHLSCTKLLISHGAPLNIEDSCGEMPLHRACHYGRTHVVKLLFESDSEPLNHRTGTDRNALHVAAASGHVASIQLFYGDPLMKTHSEHCKMRDRNEIPMQVCFCPLDPTLEDRDALGQMPLALAIHMKNRKAASNILRRGAGFAHICQQHQINMLKESVRTFSTDILDQFTSKPALFPKVDTPAGRILLHESQCSGRWDIVRRLIDNCPPGTPVCNIINAEKVLLGAIKTRAEKEVEYLIKMGADVNAKIVREDGSWKLPIRAAVGPNRTVIVEILLKYGADILSKADRGHIPFHHVVIQGDDRTIRWHLNAMCKAVVGASNPNAQQENMMGDRTAETIVFTALKHLARRGMAEKLDCLLKILEQEVGKRQWNGLLHNSVKYGRVDITRYLLDYGANPEDRVDGIIATQVLFIEVHDDGKSDYLASKVEDYETCKRLVQEAIDRRAVAKMVLGKKKGTIKSKTAGTKKTSKRR